MNFGEFKEVSVDLNGVMDEGLLEVLRASYRNLPLLTMVQPLSVTMMVPEHWFKDMDEYWEYIKATDGIGRVIDKYNEVMQAYFEALSNTLADYNDDITALVSSVMNEDMSLHFPGAVGKLEKNYRLKVLDIVEAVLDVIYIRDFFIHLKSCDNIDDYDKAYDTSLHAMCDSAPLHSFDGDVPNENDFVDMMVLRFDFDDRSIEYDDYGVKSRTDIINKLQSALEEAYGQANSD